MALKGVRAHINRLRALPALSEKEIGAALFAGGELIQVEAQLSISRGSVSGKGHVPSKPGEAPNNDTGVLANNIETTQLGPLRVRVTSNAPYSAALEMGSSRKAGATSRSFAGKTTPYGPNKVKQGPVKVEFGDSTTAARPYMRPARDAKKKDVQALVQQALGRAIKRSRSSD